VIAGAVAPVTPLTLAGLNPGWGVLAQTGLILWIGGGKISAGEGQLCCAGISAAAHRSAICCQLLGFWLDSWDGYHASAPEPGSRRVIAAVRCVAQTVWPRNKISTLSHPQLRQ